MNIQNQFTNYEYFSIFGLCLTFIPGCKSGLNCLHISYFVFSVRTCESIGHWPTECETDVIIDVCDPSTPDEVKIGWSEPNDKAGRQLESDIAHVNHLAGEDFERGSNISSYNCPQKIERGN